MFVFAKYGEVRRAKRKSAKTSAREIAKKLQRNPFSALSCLFVSPIHNERAPLPALLCCS